MRGCCAQKKKNVQVYFNEVCVAEGAVGESPLCLLSVLLVFLTLHRLYPCVVDLTCTFVAWLKAVAQAIKDSFSCSSHGKVSVERWTQSSIRTLRSRTSW